MRGLYKNTLFVLGMGAVAVFAYALKSRNSASPEHYISPPTAMMMASVGGLQFIGYDADATSGFSFVILEPVTAGTVYYFTDRGWSTTIGFPAVGTEGLLTVTLNNNYSCGTEFAVYDASGTWVVESSQGGSPSVTESGNFNLETSGDQIFAYQTSEPTVGNEGNFLAAIQMNNGWNGSNTGNNNSQQPVFFTSGNPGVGLDIVITPEVDNAKYDCSTSTGAASNILSAINTEGNWDTDNTNAFDLTAYCGMCCDNSAPVVLAPNTVDLNAAYTLTFNSVLPPGESWEIYTQGCGIGPVLTSTMGTSVQLIAPGSAQELVYFIKSTSGTCCTRVTICVIDPYAVCTDCSTGPFACGECVLSDPAPNPPLSATCDDLQLVFIIDESGSIGSAGATGDVRDGTLAFLNALNGSGVDIAIIEFSTEARLVTNYVPIDNALISAVTGYFNGTPFNSQTYSPSGSTNWHHALYIADTLSIQPDMVILFTDGSPTAYGTSTGISCNNDASLVNPVKIANRMKNDGSHIFMLGVGTVDSTNLKAMSGELKYNAGVNTIGTADWTNENFNNLAQCLEDFAYELCATVISLEKSIVDLSCDTATFQLIVRNLGGTNVATSVMVVDTFPAGYGSVIYTGPQSVCIGAACMPGQPATTFKWTVGSIPANGSDTLLIRATVLNSGSRLNTAWATSSTADTASASVDGVDLQPDTQSPMIACPADTTIDCGTSTMPLATGQASATDDTDPNPVITYSDLTFSGTLPCIVLQRTWSATDLCGNTASCNQMITIQDSVPPTIICPANRTVTCLDDTSPASQGMATASDNCTISPGVTFVDQTSGGSCPANFILSRTWIATDACSNSNTCVQMISGEDNTPPALTPARDTVLECDGAGNTAAYSDWIALHGRATASDLCSTFTWSSQVVSSMTGCGNTRRDSVRFIVIDACANADTTTANFIIEDITPPAITPATDITIDCNASPNALSDWLSAHGNAMASDDCGSINWSNNFTSAPEACAGSGIIPVTFYATDECLNVDSTTANLTVSDDSPPQIIRPARDTMVQCEGGGTSSYMTWRANLGGAQATDDCGEVSWSDREVSSTPGCGLTRSYVVRFYVEDACGNVDSTEATFAYIDTVPPVLPVPPNDTLVDCPPNAPGIVPLVAMDACSGGPILAFPTRVSESFSCDYFITDKWIFIDACGNKDSLERRIHVKDSIAPVFPTLLADDTIYFDCDDPVPGDLPGSTDNCGSVEAGYIDVDLMVSCPSERIIERTYMSADVCGNSSVVVNYLIFKDTTPPVLSPALDTLVDCDGAGNTNDLANWVANHGGATASDNCASMIIWSNRTISSMPACPNTRDDLVRFYARDECGNIDSTEAHFIIRDVTPPLFTNDPQDITIDCGMMQGSLLNDWLMNNGYAMATEECSVVSWSNDFGGEPGACGDNNSITITFTAADQCNNSSVRTAQLTIQDNIAPTILNEASDTTVDCDGSGNLAAFGSWINRHGGATAMDDCSAVSWDTALLQRTILCDFTSASTYYFIAADGCGNADTSRATFTIRDITPPLPPLAPADITVTCAGDIPSAASLNALDACAGIIPAVVSDVVSDSNCLNQFEVSRTWIFTDPCGNTSSVQQSILVSDDVPPQIQGVNDQEVIIVSCDQPLPTFNVTASDNCGMVRLVPSISSGTGSCTAESMQTLTWTAIDTCQNRTTVSITIQIVDTTPPVLTIPGDTMISCEQDTAVNILGLATAMDNCSGVTISHNDRTIPGSCRQNYTINRTWIAVDLCMNSASRIQIIEVVDTTPPTYTPPQNITIDCGAGQASDLQTWLDNHANSTGSDNCSLGVIWRYDPVISPDACGLDNSVPVNFYVADSCGNEASFTAMLTIVDEVPPTILSAARDTTVECDGAGNVADFNGWANRHGGASGSDDCGTVSWSYQVLTSTPGCASTRVDSVRFVIRDLCDNRDTTYANFIIVDNTPPMIQLPVDLTILCDEPVDPSFTGLGIAVDECGGATIRFNDAITPGSCPQEYQISRTWVAVDACNNSNSGIQQINVVDTVPPMMICPPDSFANCFAAEIDTFYYWSQYVAGGGSATDACGLDTSSYRFLYETSTMIPQGFEVLRYYTVSDSCGNADTCTHRIIIHDNIPPVALCRDSFMIIADSAGNVRVIADSVDIGSYDNCGIASITFSPAVVSCTFFYNTTIWREVTMIVRDYAGNISTCTSTVQVRCPCPLNTLPPSCADDVTISLGSSCDFKLDVADVLYNDVTGCDDPYKINVTGRAGLSLGDVVTSEYMGETLIYNVIDTMTGNRCWGRIHVEDKLPPQIVCRDLTISCFEDIPPPPAPIENCGVIPEPEILEEVYTSYSCEENADFVGYLHRTVRVSDIWGNFRECSQDIYIRRESLDNLVCPEPTEIDCCAKDAEGKAILWNTDLVDIDEKGYPHPKVLIDANGRNVGIAPPPFFVVDGDTAYAYNLNHACNIVVDYQDDVIPNCGKSYMIRRNWILKDWCYGGELRCAQLIKILDTLPPVPEHLDGITVDVNAHACKGEVIITPPAIAEECSFKFYKSDAASAYASIGYHYEIIYYDPSHPGKMLVQQGELAFGQQEKLYLPEGDHEIIWTISDGCWNQGTYVQPVWVLDNMPPEPVCDEITQVTFTDSCWARIYAKDLDDGSYDGCCGSLHFAVAQMDSIDYWRAYWHETYLQCYGEYQYVHHRDEITATIEHWIDCYVFRDYVDVTECGEEQLVVRVYEACGLPIFDPHTFIGTEHQWFCFNLFDDFACYLRLHYDELSHYGNPRPTLGCDYETQMCVSRDPVSSGYETKPNPLCCDYEFAATNDPLRIKWEAIKLSYPELVALSADRWTFDHSYSECMVQLLKDDKIAPVCVAPENITVFCDGTPWEIEVPFKLDQSGNPYVLNGPGVAWKVCSPQGDYLSNSSCPDNGWYNGIVGERCCLEVPYQQTGIGYYGGPGFGYYSDHPDEDCGYTSWTPERMDEARDNWVSWKPVYCMLWLWLDTYDDPSFGKPKFEFGDAEISDACTPQEDLKVEVVDDGSLNTCGTGTLKRTWTVTDKCGNQSSCFQTITVLPRSDFEVVFPADIYVNCSEGLNLDPDRVGAGAPILMDDECELLGITHSDETVDIGENGCYKILRTWKIIDWCVYNPDQTGFHHSPYPDVIVDDRVVAGDDRPCIYRYLKDNGDGIIEYVQVIQITDDISPVIDCRQHTEICSFSEDCQMTELTLPLGSATDNCTPAVNLAYRYSVFEGGTNNLVATGKDTVVIGVFEMGVDYDVLFVVRDWCGNEDSCVTSFMIRDCKKPTPYCHDGIVTVIMPSSGEVTIWAKDLDAGSYDNCTNPEDLTFSFSEDGSQDSTTYTCTDMPDGEEVISDKQIWVFDEAGNKDFCSVEIHIQDGSGDVCLPDSSIAFTSLQGSVTTPFDQGIASVNIFVGDRLRSATNQNGGFILTHMDKHLPQMIKPSKLDRADNGITTLDVVALQKHILGLSRIESPYLLLAADINGDGAITVVDLVELRKLILGSISEFGNSPSWVFVDRNYAMDLTHWYRAPDYIEFTDTMVGRSMDFVGIKVGDLNGTARVSELQQASVRSTSDYSLILDDDLWYRNQRVNIPVKASKSLHVSGLQVEFSLEHLSDVAIYGNALPVTSSHYRREGDKLFLSLDIAQGIHIDEGEILFTISGQIEANASTLDLISLTENDRILPEIYDVHSDVFQVNLGTDRHNTLPMLYQNKPNPFSEETLIPFFIPQPQEIEIRIITVDGAEVWKHREYMGSGNHQLAVQLPRSSEGGVYFYQLRSGERVITRKMIYITR